MCDLSSVLYTSPCVQADLDVENVLVLHQSDLTRKRRALQFHRAWQLQTMPDAPPIHRRRLKTTCFKKKVPFSCLLPFFLNIRNLTQKKMTPNGMFCVSTKVPPNDLILSRRTHVLPSPGSPMRPFRPGLNEDRMRTLVVPNDGYHQSLLAKMPHSHSSKTNQKCCCMLPHLLVFKETKMLTEARSNCGWMEKTLFCLAAIARTSTRACGMGSDPTRFSGNGFIHGSSMQSSMAHQEFLVWHGTNPEKSWDHWSVFWGVMVVGCHLKTESIYTCSKH